jgi:hypothetical protein
MPQKPQIMVKVIAKKLGIYGLQRHYPKGASHPTAGRPFLIKVQDFSIKWMKVAPDSRYSLKQVLQMQAEFWETAPKRPNSLSKERGLGIDEAVEKEEAELLEGELVVEQEGETDPETMSEAQSKAIPTPVAPEKKAKAAKAPSGNQQLI